MIAAAALVAAASAAPAATLTPRAGLEGIVRIELGGAASGKVPEPAGATFSGREPSAGGAEAPGLAQGGTDVTLIAGTDETLDALASMDETLAARVATGNVMAMPGRESASRVATNGPALAASRREVAPGLPRSERRAREFARPNGRFPVRAFGGPSPCHWGHNSFGAAQYRDRCGYPTLVIGGSSPAATVRFAGIGGGFGSKAAPQPGAGGLPGPTTPQPPVAPKPPVVQPVPVPPAWLLLATGAAPLLLRRRRK